MDLTPDRLEQAEFTKTADGYAPAEVRALLQRAARQMRELTELAASLDLTEDAAELAARRITEADRLAAERLAVAERDAREMLTDAEDDARARASAVLSEAQRRLDRMLAAERDVHDRLESAVADLNEAVARVGVDQRRELALTIEETVIEPTSVDDAPWADSERRRA